MQQTIDLLYFINYSCNITLKIKNTNNNTEEKQQKEVFQIIRVWNFHQSTLCLMMISQQAESTYQRCCQLMYEMQLKAQGYLNKPKSNSSNYNRSSLYVYACVIITKDLCVYIATNSCNKRQLKLSFKTRYNTEQNCLKIFSFHYCS